MIWRVTLAVVAGMLFLGAPRAEPVRYKIAVVALAEDLQTRAEFEDGLAAKLGQHDYDAVASHEIIPQVAELDDADVARRLSDAGVQAVLMMKPAAVGPGSTLESVRNDVSADVYANMRAFARETSPSQGDELVAVVHTAIYLMAAETPELLSSGAVWLDEPVATREEGMAKLQDLVVLNMDKARPAVRQHLGLPPLPDG